MSKYTPEMAAASLRIQHTRDDIRALEDRLHYEIADCRSVGLSWLAIGAALSTSAQAAWERFGLTYEQRVERSIRNTRALDNVQLEGLDLPPQPAPEKRTRKRRNQRGQADK